MKNPKLITALVLAGLVIMFVYQNAATVEIHFLFWEIAMSRSLLIFFLLAVGVLTGWLLHSYLYHHSVKEKAGEIEKEKREI